ncbi:MAG: hypothetical protein ACHQ1H_07100, partial [Nitrososphaerales archaeon]
EQIHKKQEIAFHLITTPEYGRYLGRRVGKGRTLDLARRLFENFHLYSWSENSCSSIITSCDLALIPLPLNDPVEAGKPENKLILFWRLAMPTIVSATPSYSRVMRQCGLAMDCHNDEEWRDVLLHYIMDENARKLAAQEARYFASNHFSEQAILQQWDTVFSSITNSFL